MMQRYNGKFDSGKSNVRRKTKRPLVVLCSLLLLLSVAVGGTMAFLKSQDDSATNQFVPGHVGCYVNGNAVSLTAETNVPTYVRVRFVINWVDADGNVYPGDVTGVKLNVLSGWTNHNNYYYYPTMLEPGKTETTSAFTSGFEYGARPADIPEEYNLQVTVLAEAVQAVGRTADSTPSYQDSWKSALDGN